MSKHCGQENVDKLLEPLHDLVITSQQKGVEKKDLYKVKKTWHKQYCVSLQSNDFWLTSLSNAWINRDNPEDILDYEKRVDALTAADVQKAAQKFFNLNNYVKAVLYPENAKVPETKKAL